MDPLAVVAVSTDLLVGGPLDGERREMPPARFYHAFESVEAPDRCPPTVFPESLDFEVTSVTYRRYDICGFPIWSTAESVTKAIALLAAGYVAERHR